MIDAWLLALNGERKGSVFPLEGKSLRIGRNPDNDLVLSDPTVSRNHAKIKAAGDIWTLEDTASKAGTYLNGFLTHDAVLRHGDRVEIGRHHFQFELGDNTSNRRRRKRLTQNLHEKGSRLAAGGRLTEALVHYEKCIVLDPGNPELRVELGNAHENKGNWLRADECFREALGLDRGNAAARAGISRIEERVRIYQKQGSLVFATHQGTIPVAHPGEWVTLTSEHFEIRFHIVHQHVREREIYRALERAYARVGKHLDYYPGRTPVEILASREEVFALAAREKLPLEPWMAGFYDGRVLRLLITHDALPDPHFPLISAVHEYTHLVCDHITRGNCPAWLSEGLALYESQNLPDAALGVLKRAADADALIPLELLENSFAALRENELIDLGYGQSFSVAEFLLTTHGWEGIRRLLREIRDTGRIGTAIENLGSTYTRLEVDWAASLRTGRGETRS